MKNTKTLAFAGAIGMALAAVAGCHKSDPVEIVRQRALERWDLLVKRSGFKAYDYLSPGYRSTHTIEQYITFVATARLQWKSATVDSVKCEDETCTAKLTVAYTVPGALLKLPKDIDYSGPVIETWVRSEGQWYFLPDSQVKPGVVGQELRSEENAQADAPAPAPSSATPATTSGAEKDKKNNE
jgi:hypothetical protein